jgi:hypothetical protein
VRRSSFFVRFTNNVIEQRCCLLRCIGRDWHLTDKPPAPEFVAYWTNNGTALSRLAALMIAVNASDTCVRRRSSFRVL